MANDALPQLLATGARRVHHEIVGLLGTGGMGPARMLRAPEVRADGREILVVSNNPQADIVMARLAPAREPQD